MTAEGLKYLNDFIEDMYITGNTRGDSIRIIRQNNILNMTKKDFERLTFRPGLNQYYHEYNHGDMMEAYEPFLGIIKDIIEKNNLDMDTVFDKAEVYSLHREIFKSYFMNQLCERRDELILAELDFEYERMTDGIVGMLHYLSKKYPIFILLNKVNLITTSSVTILQRLFESELTKLKIIGIVNQLRSVSTYVTNPYTEFIGECEEKNCISDWTVEKTEEVDTDISFSLKLDNTNNYFRKINNMFHLFAFDQAYNYLNFMYQRIELDKLRVSVDIRVHMLELYIMACIYKKNYSFARLLCDSLRQLEAGELEQEKNYMYYYLIATVNMCNGNQQAAKNYAEQCREFVSDDKTEFKVELLSNMILLRGWNEIWIVEKDIEVSQKLLDWCETYGYQNHLAHIYVYCYDNNNKCFAVPNGIEDRLPHVMKGIRIAEKLGNYRFLIEAYRKNVMLASCNGYNNTSNYFYEKIISIAHKAHDRMVEAHVCNGLGYNCSATDNFVAAHDYYNKALELYFELKSSDYIMETLYNMGMNSILSGDYGSAMDYLMTIQNVMKILRKTGLRVCNVSKLYGLIALAAFKMEKYHTAHFYLNKTKQFLENILDFEQAEADSYLWDDDLFLLYYLTALLKQHEEEYEAALDNYEKANVFMKRSAGSMYFNYSLYVWDKSNLYKAMGNKTERDQLLKEARKFFGRKGNFYRIQMIDELLYNGEWKFYIMEMPLRNVNLKDIIKLVKLERIENEAKEKKIDIRFFTAFQELICHSYKNVKAQTDTLIFNFKNNFNIDNIIFISCEEDRDIVQYSTLPYELSEADIKLLTGYFRVNSDGFAISKFSNNYYEYEQILGIFRKSKLFSIIAVPLYNNVTLTSVFIVFDCVCNNWNTIVRRKVMEESDLEIYRFIFRQIVDAGEKYKLNDRLKKQAVTDELTGLYNRKGYYEKIDSLMEKSYDSLGQTDAALLYADLDHFKYYNDTFGHHVGDALLVEFSKIFAMACGERGIAFRFGGDEFVMILETADRNEIQKVVDALYYFIREEDGFKRTVAEYVEGEPDIPEECKVTCSIGIAYQKGIRSFEEYSELRKLADDAMYKVKNTGRGFAEWIIVS